MRKAILTIHLYLSLIAGVFIFILGVTGCIMAFENELDHLFHAKKYDVTPQSRLLSLDALAQKMESVFPNDTLQQFYTSASPDISHQIYYADKKVYINQYTGDILGVEKNADSWSAALTFIHQLHLRLAFKNVNDLGSSIMTWAGLSMTVCVLTGIILWWKQKRILINLKGLKRRLWYDLHHVIGFAFFLLLLSISLTGVFIGLEKTLVPFAYKASNSAPRLIPNLEVNAPPGLSPISMDSAMTIARHQIPGATPFSINAPKPHEAYLVRLRFPEDTTPGGRSKVIIDPYTSQVLFSEGSRTAPTVAKLVNLNRAIHTGDLLGVPGRIIGSIVSLIAVFQLVSGLLIWLRKRPVTRNKFVNGSFNQLNL